ncbi:hypothetical protein, partial [Ciceribacter sichuanensis]
SPTEHRSIHIDWLPSRDLRDQNTVSYESGFKRFGNPECRLGLGCERELACGSRSCCHKPEDKKEKMR